MENVPSLDLGYIFSAIYNFFASIFQFIFGSTFHAGSFLVVVLSFCFLVFITWAIYIRVRIYEVDEELDGQYKEHFIKPEMKADIVDARWRKILEHFSSANPNDWRVAIINADVMLDELLDSLGYTGDGIGEKLSTVRIQDFPTLQSASEAHKIRNKVAHFGVDYNLSEREKEVARKHFENVFKGAGII